MNWFTLNNLYSNCHTHVVQWQKYGQGEVQLRLFFTSQALFSKAVTIQTPSHRSWTEDSPPVRGPCPARSPPAAGGSGPRRPPVRGRSRTCGPRAGPEAGSVRITGANSTDRSHEEVLSLVAEVEIDTVLPLSSCCGEKTFNYFSSWVKESEQKTQLSATYTVQNFRDAVEHAQ